MIAHQLQPWKEVQEDTRRCETVVVGERLELRNESTGNMLTK